MILYECHLKNIKRIPPLKQYVWTAYTHTKVLIVNAARTEGSSSSDYPRFFPANTVYLRRVSCGKGDLSQIGHFNPVCPRVGGKTFCGSSSCGGRTVFLQSILPTVLKAHTPQLIVALSQSRAPHRPSARQRARTSLTHPYPKKWV